MDCSALLKAQQQDFCHRLKIGNLLISQKSDLHSESCILAEEVVEKITLESTVEAQNIVDHNSLNINKQDVVNLLFYRRLAIEAFLSQFGDLVWLDTTDNNQSESTLDCSSFRIKSNTSIKVLLKNYHGNLENIKLTLSSKELEKYHLVVFSFSAKEENTNAPKLKKIFLGFMPLNFSLLKEEVKKEITVSELLYIGGLNYYLSNGITINKSLSISAKKYFQKGDYHQAIKLFDQLVTEENATEEDLFLRGICRYKLGNQEIAIKDFSQVTQLNNNHVKAYHWLGLVSQKLEKYEEALNIYNQEIKLDSLNFFAYFQRASVKTKLNQLIDALEDYNIAGKINNKFFQVYYNRACLYYYLGDQQSAIEDYKKAIKIRPNLYQAYYNLGIIHQEFGDYPKAMKQYQLAIKLNPKYIQAYYNLAILQANLGLYKRSINNYQEALKINPDFIQANYNKNSLSLLLKNQGHILLDSTQVRAFLEQTPNIISIDDQEQISEDDEEKYGTLSGDRTTDNDDLDDFWK